MGIDMDTTVEDQASRVGNVEKEVGNGDTGVPGARETSSAGVSANSGEKLDATIPVEPGQSADGDERARSGKSEREDGSSRAGSPSEPSEGASTSASPSNHDNPPSASSALDSRATEKPATAVEAEERNVDEDNLDLSASNSFQSPLHTPSPLVHAAQELDNARSTFSPVPEMTSQPGPRETQVDAPGLGIPFELQQPESEIVANGTQVNALPKAILEPEPEPPVDMGRLLNSIDITKKATFLRQRLSSLGTRPSGFRAGPTLDKLENPFSSPPSSPPLHTPHAWREKRQPGSPSSPSPAFKPEGWKPEPPRTPVTPGRKRKLDYGSTPFRSPSDLMALTLESPGRKGDDAGEELEAINKRRGKTWISQAASPARRPDVADSLTRLGRRASMGTGPRLGIALPKRVMVEQQQPVVPPRRAMGIEGYLVDRYGDVLGGSRYPPPLPSPQASTSTSSTRTRPEPTILGHKRRISTGIVTSSTVAANGSGEKYVSFMTGKKPRSASHSSGRRPPASSTQGTGEMTEAANVLTGMLGGSPLRRSTASPARPERPSKPYSRPKGEDLGFRMPPARTRLPGSSDPNTLPPLLSSGQITPPKQISRLPRVRHTDGALVQSGSDEDDQRAAELMIFLAQSPGSTATGETARPKRASLIQGAGVGRVLFGRPDGGDAVEMRDVG